MRALLLGLAFGLTMVAGAAEAGSMSVVAASNSSLIAIDLSTIKKVDLHRVAFWVVSVDPKTVTLGGAREDFQVIRELLDCKDDTLTATYVADYLVDVSQPTYSTNLNANPEPVIPGTIATEYQNLACSPKASDIANATAVSYNEMAQRYRTYITKGR